MAHVQTQRTLRNPFENGLIVAEQSDGNDLVQKGNDVITFRPLLLVEQKIDQFTANFVSLKKQRNEKGKDNRNLRRNKMKN